MQAGLGLDAAIERVGRDMRITCPAIAEEFTLTGLTLRAGLQRSAALQQLSDRMGLPDVEGLVGMLIQADRFGSSMAQSLFLYSESLRTKRRLEAQGVRCVLVSGGFSFFTSRVARAAGFDTDRAQLRAVFYGLGSDGTVGANKASAKIVGDRTALHAQGASVALSGTRASVLEELAGRLGSRSHVLPCNLGDKDAVEALVPAAEAAPVAPEPAAPAAVPQSEPDKPAAAPEPLSRGTLRRISRPSRAASAASVSACEATETYSPAAMDIAPATRPATPATRISLGDFAATATPATRLAVEMMPSFAPRTAASAALNVKGRMNALFGLRLVFFAVFFFGKTEFATFYKSDSDFISHALHVDMLLASIFY